MPYSQDNGSPHKNQYGSYRRDCSGYVSMAWKLNASYTTYSIQPLMNTIPRADLTFGDALWKRDGDSGHLALFVGWADGAHTKPIVWEEYDYGHFAEERVWSASYAATFTPKRYKNILEDPAPEEPDTTPKYVRSVVNAGNSQAYGIAADGHVVSTFWSANNATNGGWSGWFTIPTGYGDGVVGPNATVTVSTLNGAPQLFTTAPDGRVISTFWSANTTTNGGWHEWFPIPGGFSDGIVAPNAVVTALGNQIYTTAPDGRVMSTFWSADITTNGGWHEWFAIPTGYGDGTTAPNSTITATTLNGQTHLFATAPDGHVIATFWSPDVTANGGWHDWFTIPTGYADGVAAPNSVVTATVLNGTVQLFTTAPDGRVISTFWSASATTNGGWNGWFPIPGGHQDGKTRANSTISVQDGQLYTTAPDGRVISTFWSPNTTTNGGWHDWFTIPTGYADGVTAASTAVSATKLNGQPQLFTVASDGKVISTFWSANTTTNGGWNGWFPIFGGAGNGSVRS
ncbi:hypothetical protein [Actinokineospora globicatena]|uniref:hypothetical protein n=1 Tax=Actinokineospora globicatena TaxID=103729 RepID=UPI002556D736|nr:hypothetical protein [Actinokineospora globicatena]